MRSHRYLADEYPHFFYPSLAERIGLNESIIIQQIHGWIQTYLKDPAKYREKHYHDGAWWTWDSYPDWHEKLPYLSESTIKRTLVSLRKQGLVRVGNYNALKIDRTYWYTINYGEYDKLWSNPAYQETKTDSPSDQNDQMEEANLDRPLPVSSPVPSAVLEEPPLADSPPDDIDETAASFKTPAPTTPRTKEQHLDSIRGALETFEQNGGRPGVADPTQDDVAWCNGPVNAWCKIAKKDAAQLSNGTRYKLAGIFRQVGAITDGSPAQIAVAIEQFPFEYDWWEEKVGFEWPGDGFCNRLGMIMTPDAEPEPIDLDNPSGDTRPITVY